MLCTRCHPNDHVVTICSNLLGVNFNAVKLNDSFFGRKTACGLILILPKTLCSRQSNCVFQTGIHQKEIVTDLCTHSCKLERQEVDVPRHLNLWPVLRKHLKREGLQFCEIGWYCRRWFGKCMSACNFFIFFPAWFTRPATTFKAVKFSVCRSVARTRIAMGHKRVPPPVASTLPHGDHPGTEHTHTRTTWICFPRYSR